MTGKPIHEALADVMRAIGAVGKSDWNDFHKYRFRGVDTILDAVAPALREHGVVPIPQVRKITSRDVTTAQNKTSREVTLKVDYVFLGPAGDSVTVSVPGEAQDSGDKAVSKAMSVAYRTALIQVFAIATGQRDPDADSFERQRSPYDRAVADVQALAAKRGWSLSDLQHDYGVFVGDESADIQRASLEQLQGYLAQLDPPPVTTTVKRRARTQATGEAQR